MTAPAIVAPGMMGSGVARRLAETGAHLTSAWTDAPRPPTSRHSRGLPITD